MGPTHAPRIRSGKPCIRGARITVSDIFDDLGGGMTVDALLAAFPELTAADICATMPLVAGMGPPPFPPSWFRRDALSDFLEELATAGRVAPLLARQETGFGLAFGDDVRDEVVEQPLHARP